MPRIPTGRGAEIRKAYEDAGIARARFAELAGVLAKTVTNATTDGRSVSRPMAVRIARALNALQPAEKWSADRIFAPAGQEATDEAPGEAEEIRGAA